MKQPRKQKKIAFNTHMNIAKSPQGARIFSRREPVAGSIRFQPNSSQLIHLKPRGAGVGEVLKFVTTLSDKHIVAGKCLEIKSPY